MTIHAFTELHNNFPAFINLSEQPDGTIKLSVRTRGNAGRDYASIELTHAQAEDLAEAIFKHVYDEGDRHPAPVGDGGLPVQDGHDQMLRDMLTIQEACGLHTDEYAPGSVIEYIKELEADAHAAPQVAAKNQCDGCAAGHELTEGTHYINGWPSMKCEQSKYAPQVAQVVAGGLTYAAKPPCEHDWQLQPHTTSGPMTERCTKCWIYRNVAFATKEQTS